MSNLSWLNPTPHAIAVYASRPLSPVAAQHSLPSGRYSLLGPDFHRLDRTSLRLAHSLDHLVCAQKDRGWQRHAEKLRGLEVRHELESCRALRRQLGHLGTMQHLARHTSCLAIKSLNVWAVGQQPALSCYVR